MTATDLFKPHTLTVTRTAFPPGLPGEDEFVETEYDLSCPGVTDHCRLYLDCAARPEEQATLLDAADDGQPLIAHGRRHLYIDGMWMAETDQCLYVGHDQLPDRAASLDLPSGEYLVDVDYMGDGDIELVLLDETVSK